MLYNEYRPCNLNEVKGQEHIVELVKNMPRGKFPHAVLFVGPRGVGKTTMARIWAKTLNCLSPNKNEPCGVCVNCKSISDGTASDVIELDAASNNGVADIRRIKESVSIVSVLPNRVYIIDEVQRLSKEGFDALLKLLEEPPKNVYFVLCTTDYYSVPATIKSRCATYHFRNIDTDEIANHLELICKGEDFIYEFEALYTIAKAANGGMRDAISLLEQLSVKPITAENVRVSLGILPDEEIYNFLCKVLSCDTYSSIEKIDELEQLGIVNVIVDNVINMSIDVMTLLNNGNIYNTKDYISLILELIETMNQNGLNESLEKELFLICELFSQIRGFETDALSVKCTTINCINQIKARRQKANQENEIYSLISKLEDKVKRLEALLSSNSTVSNASKIQESSIDKLHSEPTQKLHEGDPFDNINMEIEIDDSLDDKLVSPDVDDIDSEELEFNDNEDNSSSYKESESNSIPFDKQQINVSKKKVMSINANGIRSYTDTGAVAAGPEEVEEKKPESKTESNKQDKEQSLVDDFFNAIFG